MLVCSPSAPKALFFFLFSDFRFWRTTGLLLKKKFSSSSSFSFWLTPFLISFVNEPLSLSS